MFNKTIGEIVAEDFRTAAVFSKYKIDFCCRGDKTVEHVCEKKSINSDELVKELEESITSKNESVDFNSWPLDLLADYIVKTHHEYIREKVPPLTQFLTKVYKVHGERNPELKEILELFLQSSEDLLTHLKKEEMILFPFIRKMVEAKSSNQPMQPGHFGSIENPIAMMMDDHSVEGDRFRKISELSHGYTPPEGACNTYKVSFSMLDEFEQNLHKHIHLENNILFPKSIKMEASFN
ncbi:iron-sulfur cluster repair di-iron protein [Apibacter raozihei]|uniref:iron-sulfur cluster repair di-iron protein n=1 Tax=Apibacter TaxID=1778601 RepID=UPI000FE2B5EA|nr:MULTISPECIES: iron-sulfur cluster repair di-iron protein [Apibacter]